MGRGPWVTSSGQRSVASFHPRPMAHGSRRIADSGQPQAREPTAHSECSRRPTKNRFAAPLRSRHRREDRPALDGGTAQHAIAPMMARAPRRGEASSQHRIKKRLGRLRHVGEREPRQMVLARSRRSSRARPPFGVRCGLMLGAEPNHARSSGRTSAWWSTTPAGTRSQSHAATSSSCSPAGR